MTHRRHAYTRVERVPTKAATGTPWNAHCHVCCCRLEVNTEAAELGALVPTTPCSWWFASQAEALMKALGHLGEHVEVTG